MRRRPLAVALVLAALAGGCGIPDNSPVVPLGPGPAKPGAATGEDSAPTKALRTDTSDRTQFVRNYLEVAAAGDNDSVAEARAFMSKEMAASFKPSNDLQVIRLSAAPLVNPGSDVVTVTAQVIGTLKGNGVLALTPSSGTVVTYRLTVSRIDDQTWYVTQAPPVLLLSDTALAEFYTRRTIYFWNKDHTGLVPDVRYMPRGVPTEQQPTEVLNWLTGGPAPWLEAVVDPLPADTKLVGVVPAVSDNRLQVTLNEKALAADYQTSDPGALDRLQTQLRWSLRPNLPPSAAGVLELNIEHFDERDYSDNRYLAANFAYHTVAAPERFVVYGGKVSRLSRSADADGPVPVLTPQDNRNVVKAGFGATAKRTYAAVVAQNGEVQSLKVGWAQPGAQAALRAVTKLPAPIGRPEWAVTPVDNPGDGTVGLVTANGRLYRFTPDGAVNEVTWSGGPKSISAIAVAPDARRVALLSGGRLYLSTLLNNADDPQLTTPTLVPTQMSPITGVDWGSEGTLVVAGRKRDSKRAALMDVYLDGASQLDRQGDLGSNDVTDLVTFPASPSGNEESGVPLAYELSGAAYDESSTERTITAADLTPAVPTPRPDTPKPSSPFFLN